MEFQKPRVFKRNGSWAVDRKGWGESSFIVRDAYRAVEYLERADEEERLKRIRQIENPPFVSAEYLSTY